LGRGFYWRENLSDIYNTQDGKLAPRMEGYFVRGAGTSPCEIEGENPREKATRESRTTSSVLSQQNKPDGAAAEASRVTVARLALILGRRG
jgi:hypothetical protein